MQNHVRRFVSRDFTVRASVVDGTAVVREMQSIQRTLPLATLGVGRAMIGALLLSSHLKEGHRVGLLFKGQGPLASFYAEAAFTGEVRGYCPVPRYQSDHLQLKRALGEGTLTVERHQPFQKQPFTGTVELVSSEVGEDIAFYLHQSQQIRSVIVLGVHLGSRGQVDAAGGFLVEVMPGVEESVIQRIEDNYKQNPVSVSQLILEKKDLEAAVAHIFEGIPYAEIPHDFAVRYACPCTRERLKNALTLFGEDELQEMIDEQKPAESTCQMCGRNYEISIPELVEIHARLRRRSMH